MASITKALDKGIDPTPFLDPKYDYILMNLFTEYLDKGEDITPILDERIPIRVMEYMMCDSSHNEQIYGLLDQGWSEEQLLEICYGFFRRVDSTPYINLTHNRNCIHLINRTLCYGLDPTCMAKEGYDEVQLECLFFGLLGEYNVDEYADPNIDASEMTMHERVYLYMRENNVDDFEEAYNLVRDL